MKTKWLAIPLLTLILISPSVSAAGGRDRDDRRQDRQMNRIETGVRRGDIDRREYRHLMREQHRIDRYEDRAKRDGRLTPGERMRMDWIQDRAGRHIHHAMQDGPCRWDAPPRCDHHRDRYNRHCGCLGCRLFFGFTFYDR